MFLVNKMHLKLPKKSEVLLRHVLSMLAVPLTAIHVHFHFPV